jgi:hypothetical protein
MKSINRVARLQARVADFKKGKQSGSIDGKKVLRWETGGFHKPGSLNK